MKKSNKKSVAKKLNSEPSRIERWRMIAERELANPTADIHGDLSLLSICSDIEGTDPVSLVVSKITSERGGGKIVKKCPANPWGPKYMAYLDTDMEINAIKRTRNIYEREIVLNAIDSYTVFLYYGNQKMTEIVKDFGEAALRKFYRKGDGGTSKSFLRLVIDAMKHSAE